MRIIIAAIGKLKDSPERALFAEYCKRTPWKIELKEIAPRKPLAKAEETALLMDASKGAERIVALDEQGETLSSESFARRIGAWQNEGASSLGFILGGADGLDRAQLKGLALTLSFGRLTWPHMLARVMLAEQLYRAHALLANHPYHRA